MILPPLALALACSPCADLDLRDTHDLLGVAEEEELAQAHSEWLSWVGDDRVCIDRIVVRDRDDAIDRRGQTIWIDAGYEDRAHLARWGMCGALDASEDHTGARPDLFGEDAGQAFIEACAWGPLDYRWKDVSRAACGDDQLSDRDRYMSDLVYPFAPAGRRDGELTARVGGLLGPIDGLFTNLGDRILAWHSTRGQGRQGVYLIDPATGRREPVWSHVGNRPQGLFGGRDEAAIQLLEGDGTARMVLFDPKGARREITMDRDLWIERGVVGHGAVWGVSKSAFPTDLLARVDLATGAVQEFALPPSDPGLELLISGLQVIADGLYVELYQATVEVGSDFILITVFGYQTWRYQPDSEHWQQIGSDLHLLDAGVDRQGRIVGAVFSDAGRVLAAYDVDADRLLLSEDLCLDVEGPQLVTGDQAWRSVRVDEAWHLQAIQLE